MSQLDTSRRGHIHRLPPSAVPLQEDNDAHWYVLLGSDDDGEADVFMYGTSSVADCADGAPCFECEPHPPGPPGTGIRKLTHFNGCAIVRSNGHVRSLGRMGELPASLHSRVDDVIREGLGLGKGLPVDSCRGRIVRLTKAAAKETRTRYGVLITCPPYSRRRRYGVMVPLIDNARSLPEIPPEWTYLSAPWGPTVTKKRETTGFYASPCDVVSVYHSRQVEHVFTTTLSDLQVRNLEAQVAAYLAL